MITPLMPKATAVWLIDHTTLTFEQIAEFCGLHVLEVQALADHGDILGSDPILQGQLTEEEIERCQKDPSARLQLSVQMNDMLTAKSKARKRYTPVSKRQDKPDAIAWLLKNHPELTDAQIIRLLGTTKTTITSIRDKTHHNASQIKSRHPVQLGLCAMSDLEAELAVAQRRGGGAERSTLEHTAYPDQDEDHGKRF